MLSTVIASNLPTVYAAHKVVLVIVSYCISTPPIASFRDSWMISSGLPGHSLLSAWIMRYPHQFSSLCFCLSSFHSNLYDSSVYYGWIYGILVDIWHGYYKDCWNLVSTQGDVCFKHPNYLLLTGTNSMLVIIYSYSMISISTSDP
jgi:hypothetical protein